MQTGTNVHTIRILPGNELKSSIQTFVKSKNLKAAFIVTCVGSVKKAKLRFATPSTEGSSSERVVLFNENFEICSLVGTVSTVGSHLHVTLSRADGSVVGGHVMGDMEVQTTAEVVIGESLAEEYTREYDAKTGYDELVVNQRW